MVTTTTTRRLGAGTAAFALCATLLAALPAEAQVRTGLGPGGFRPAPRIAPVAFGRTAPSAWGNSGFYGVNRVPANQGVVIGGLYGGYGAVNGRGPGIAALNGNGYGPGIAALNGNGYGRGIAALNGNGPGRRIAALNGNGYGRGIAALNGNGPGRRIAALNGNGGFYGGYGGYAGYGGYGGYAGYGGYGGYGGYPGYGGYAGYGGYGGYGGYAGYGSVAPYSSVFATSSPTLSTHCSTTQTTYSDTSGTANFGNYRACY